MEAAGHFREHALARSIQTLSVRKTELAAVRMTRQDDVGVSCRVISQILRFVSQHDCEGAIFFFTDIPELLQKYGGLKAGPQFPSDLLSGVYAGFRDTHDIDMRTVLFKLLASIEHDMHAQQFKFLIKGMDPGLTNLQLVISVHIINRRNFQKTGNRLQCRHEICVISVHKIPGDRNNIRISVPDHLQQFPLFLPEILTLQVGNMCNAKSAESFRHTFRAKTILRCDQRPVAVFQSPVQTVCSDPGHSSGCRGRQCAPRCHSFFHNLPRFKV